MLSQVRLLQPVFCVATDMPWCTMACSSCVWVTVKVAARNQEDLGDACGPSYQAGRSAERNHSRFVRLRSECPACHCFPQVLVARLPQSAIPDVSHHSDVSCAIS